MPKEDPHLTISHYERTDEQNFAVGLTPHIKRTPYCQVYHLLTISSRS